MKIRKLLLSGIALLITFSSIADEGMWMVNNLTKALVEKMKSQGMEINPDEIYSTDHLSITDAIVALNFEGTGSIISQNGLVITNHHVAYADIHSISTPEHNYLEDGFWADNMADEIPIPGKNAYILKKFVDVTDEVNAIIAEEKAAGKAAGMRRVSHLVETKYADPEYEVSLSSMWAGSKYFLSYYQVYTDLRLVAAPPVSISAFGGDVDNWEWPQHKCDFAMYRIYTAPDGSPADFSEENIPLKAEKYLKISTEGYKPGDFTMVLGFPGITHRYASSENVNFLQNVSYPISNRLRGEQMAIISKWMNADPAIRLMYADKYFNLSNVQENQEGFVQCCSRFSVMWDKRAQEAAMAGKEYTNLFNAIKEKYEAVSEAEANLLYYRESFVRGTSLGVIALRLHNIRKVDIEEEYRNIDLRVEKDLFYLGVKEFYANVSDLYWGEYQKELYGQFGKDWKAVADYLWIDRPMTRDDSIYKFLNDVGVSDFNNKISEIEGDVTVNELVRRYTKALYEWREDHNILQYPDANSTLRFTFGKVASFERDGKMLPWQTYTDEILVKENPAEYDFTLKPQWRKLLKKKAHSMPVNFVTDNDITGGNSGSPVLNAKGEIIGLAFDGNKESLAGDVSWTKDYNRCINVDIRFVLWTLKNYGKTTNILTEINK